MRVTLRYCSGILWNLAACREHRNSAYCRSSVEQFETCIVQPFPEATTDDQESTSILNALLLALEKQKYWSKPLSRQSKCDGSDTEQAGQRRSIMMVACCYSLRDSRRIECNDLTSCKHPYPGHIEIASCCILRRRGLTLSYRSCCADAVEQTG